MRPCPNPTHLPNHQTLSSNHQFSQRICYVEYYSAHALWREIRNFASQKFRLTPASLFER